MKYRHEYKYVIDARQEAILRVRIGGLLEPDRHAGETGSYLVRSAYFDDCLDSCLNDNLLGAEPRSKFRLRYYGNDPGTIRLEKKSKQKGMTQKEICPVAAEEAEALLSGGFPAAESRMPPLKQRLLTELTQRALQPRAIVTYERMPFVYPGGNVRVTFDRMLSSSEEIEHYMTGDYLTRPVFPLGQSVLEVKWDELLPPFIKEALQLEDLQWTAFSKYYMCRAVHL